MAHLLIDTVKTDAGKKYLPFGRHDVRLFADKKTARPFRKLAASADGTCPECGGNAALHLVIPPKDKFTRTILKTVKVILSSHPEAKIAEKLSWLKDLDEAAQNSTTQPEDKPKNKKAT